jgi:DNA-binding helix-hairpin-helix protein with protein kinase domain
MNIVKSTFVSLESVLAGANTPPNFRVSVALALNLVAALQNISTRGLCYGDISLDNLLINTTDASVMIIDMDNLLLAHEVRMVQGSPFFCAPENSNEALPESDMFSFAIYLFLMLTYQHPYDGPDNLIEDKDNQESLVNNGQFIFSAHDHSNKVNSGPAFNNWGELTADLQRCFGTTFTQSKNIAKRTRYVEWRQHLQKLSDSLVECSACGHIQIAAKKCDSCSGTINYCYLSFEGGRNGYGVVTEQFSVIPEFQLEVRNGELLLKNNSTASVMCIYNDEIFSVDAGRAVKAKSSLRLKVGSATYSVL